MSDRSTRPEWRRAYLNRTVTETQPGGAAERRRKERGPAAAAISRRAIPLAALFRIVPTS
jgi:hypothetical protein